MLSYLNLMLPFLSRLPQKFSRDKTWIGSVSHDDKIRFWHAEYLFEEDDDDEEEEKGETAGGASGVNAEGGGEGGWG